MDTTLELQSQLISAVATAALLLSPVTTSIATEAVTTRFEIQADSFVTNLDTGRANVETETNGVLVRAVSKYFPLVHWTASADASAPATVTLALTSRDAQPLPAILLAWSASVDGAMLKLPELPPVELYSPFALDRETHDPIVLSQLLQTAIDGWFTNESNRSLFQRSLLRNIPFARRVEVDPRSERILVPFSLASTKMDRESKLRVRFEIVAPSGLIQSGELDVTGLIEGLGSGGKVATGGRVTEFNFSAAPTVAGWSPEIPTLLAQPKKTLVFVELYIYSEAPTLNGNFVQP